MTLHHPVYKWRNGGVSQNPVACSASQTSLMARNFVQMYPDKDADGAPDATDNCIDDANADQMDSDADGEGDVCDATPFPPARRRSSSSSCDYGDASAASGAGCWVLAIPFAGLVMGRRRVLVFGTRTR